jgi:2-octaprenyl-6-methoxyphenol hydroxylase
LPATPIGEIHVSQRGGFGRTLLAATDGDTLGHVVRYGALVAALEAALARVYTADAQLLRCASCRVAAIDRAADTLRVTLADGGEKRRIGARLVVHAEGESAAADTRVHDYRQCAIVAEVTPARAHGGRAWERFTGEGPLALLPLGADFSLVYTVGAERVAALLAQSDAAFLARLRADFGGRLDFRSLGARAAFPLALRVRRHVVGEREAWIGAAAQTLHPVAGQGFNLGLRDAATLARQLATALADGGTDVGDAATLAAWARSRRCDRYGTIAITDGLVRAFASTPLAAWRGAGLAALDVCPPLRRALTRRMMFGAAR